MNPSYDYVFLNLEGSYDSAIADLKGYSMLACGIGSLAQALGGDRAGAETGTQKVLAEARRL